MVKYIISMNGFNTKEQGFLCREIACIDLDSWYIESFHFYIDPQHFENNPKDCWTANYARDYVHGLCWKETAGLPQDAVNMLVKYWVEKAAKPNRKIAYKGGNNKKAACLRNGIQEKDLVNLEDLRCPKLEALFNERTVKKTCGQQRPLLNRKLAHCAEQKVLCYAIWYGLNENWDLNIPAHILS